LFHEWGNGSACDDWVHIREQARALFEAAGVQEPFHPEMRTEEQVDAFLSQHGAHVIAQIPCEQDAPTPMREFLRSIESGECSYTWKLPPSIHTRCVAAILEWAQSRFDLDRPIARQHGLEDLPVARIAVPTTASHQRSAEEGCFNFHNGVWLPRQITRMPVIAVLGAIYRRRRQENYGIVDEEGSQKREVCPSKNAFSRWPTSYQIYR
jgi:hypothetical protein